MCRHSPIVAQWRESTPTPSRYDPYPVSPSGTAKEIEMRLLPIVLPNAMGVHWLQAGSVMDA
jgi:hypothetical protein